ncbi:UDP-N-acetylmuramate dehydrogenase [Lactobacillus sp. LC28-10]|uniref:UDP-N-acetylenolpyruvoylglucosamine reductase n=1 Tax=Secundilactobacillus angelensis TaxID=2722706 RepID=A0ABX1KYN5_9LACO|nr:UDP-N-acetylmuramate dehydrogenase [Secundilactobacillus angelensis]MCH5462152.1 UDP-N-acetylmuramate dehydrogenase [Secundilactobacillus angelensis]NLR18367.1 UDP-N-acetylmuramate dehydrogenase [Secundilactobacillus angelensis]
MTADIIAAFPKVKLMQNEPLSNYTNTKTGGKADFLAFPADLAEVKALVLYANEQKLPITVIGNASNLIVKDGGIRGLVMILTEMNHIEVADNQITAESGASIIEVTKVAQAASLTGLEFAAGIPGSVGGAIFMNAGAYGGEISLVADSVTVLTPEAKLKTIQRTDLDFGYRHSRVQDEGDIVITATFRLQPGDATKIQAKMDDLNARRAARQPLELPSCGSVFKRPTGYFAGKLIHDAGLQGYQSGGAQVSTKHAGFIVNVDHATASDYLAVIQHVQATVLAKAGVKLETEVRIIGEDPVLN